MYVYTDVHAYISKHTHTCISIYLLYVFIVYIWNCWDKARCGKGMSNAAVHVLPLGESSALLHGLSCHVPKRKLPGDELTIYTLTFNRATM